MDPALRHLIESLHHGPVRYALSLTGGGATTAGLLLSVPGGSRTVLEVIVPYHETALAEFLGHPPEQYCSAAVAQAMAQRAFERAGWLAPRDVVAGVGCTASLATDRPKRGDHRFFLAIRTAGQSGVHSLTLAKDARDRVAEEQVLSLIMLNALAESFGIADRVPVPLLPGETIQVDRAATDALAALLSGTLPALCAEVDGRLRADAPRPVALLPGSFNPLHDGHRQLAEVAAARSGLPVAFELGVTNVDKPTLSAEEVRHRLRQGFGRPVWLTRAPRFLEKAELFPGALFVVGADTAERIVAARYYEGSEERLHAALERLRGLGCRFLVAGRACAGKHVGCDELTIPAPYRDMFTGIPESEFRCDVSSTQLRAQ